MHTSIKTALFAFFLAAGGCLWGQQEDLPTEQVEVIKDFNARLAETQRFQLQPELPPLDTMTKRQSYDITARTLEVQYLPPRIRPIAFRDEENPPTYRGYAKLGGGFPNALYADAAYNLSGTENFVMDVDLQHYSANNSNNLENQRMSRTDIDLDGTYYFDQGFAVQAGAGYQLNNVFFYGYNDFRTEDDPLSFSKDDVRQRFSLFNVNAEAFNHLRTVGDFSYRAAIDFYHLQDNYSARENGFDVLLQATKWFEATHNLDAELEFDLSSFRDTARQTLNIVRLRPSYTSHSSNFRVKLGFNLAASDGEVFFYPNVEASLNVIENILTAFAGAEGDLRKNNFRHLTEYNPLLTSRPELRNTDYVEFYGGVRGEVLGADYHAQAGYQRARDLALFLSNGDTIPRFDAIYDTVDIFTIKGGITIPLFDGLQLTGTVAQNFFSPNNEEKAWHLPGLDINVGATYSLMDGKLNLRADLFVQNGVPFRNAEGEAENLNGLYDLSAAAEYLFNDRIGAFVRVNNMLDNRRERWNRYPVFGINGVAGISARF